MITIRETTFSDIDAALNIYSLAKQFMRTSGNHAQWTGDYPAQADIINDINRHCSFVGVDQANKIHFIFAFITAPDHTYNYIDGNWLNDRPYGTIHRIASDGSIPRVVEIACDFCNKICPNIRIDTHADNQPMQRALERLDFSLCGTIYLADGAPRLAFQKSWPRLWLFNPENDIALAQGSANFTPPAAAVKLARSGATLPFWMADECDRVMCHGVDDRWLTDIQSEFDIKSEPWNGSTDILPNPWGWSLPVRNNLVEAGFAPEQLPSDMSICKLRALSHRRTSVFVADLLRKSLQFEIWPTAIEVFSTDEISALVAESSCVVKAPWSSSGRGIAFADKNTIQNQLPRFAGTIRRQGSLLVEKHAHRLLDFAMLFDYAFGQCQFVGFSVFDTLANGSYSGNIVAPQSQLLDRITQFIPLEQIELVQKALPNALTKVLSYNYFGPVGVDMLVAQTAHGPILHAVVEINLRYTMGRVALSLYQKIGRVGHFTINPANVSTNPNAIRLTPPGTDFTFALI